MWVSCGLFADYTNRSTTMTTTDPVALTLMELFVDGSGVLYAAVVEVTGFADPDRPPYLEVVAQVGEREWEQFWKMTPVEGRTLAARLVEIADTIEASQR
jgi:hypothetical protein